MSTTIDQRVVEMRFDNKHFESNVQTTMSTLDKLKQKLNLSGSAKGLEGISSAAKKVDMSGLSTGIDTVHAKFSALQVMGVTALANITNSAVNAGKRMVSALTIDPIKTGFQEYETQINAVQTILANTQKEGTNVEIVNKALDELNAYADKTIYNFTEMTRNIGTFTAAGVELQTSVDAIQGIANLAAVSGSTSQQASTAMYQLSQALASGTVKLMDWNSVVNAGMGGQVFQDALKETSELLGTGAEAAIKAEGSFRDSLTTGWLTSEVLTETLKKFTTSGANEYVAKYTGLSEKAVQAALDEAEARYGEADAIEYASKALAEKSGKNAKEIKDALQFAKNAEDAATKVKTFTQLWDVLKEAAQSGWGQTWRLIVGDFEEAKNLITPLADKLTGIINKFSEARNKLLESALGKSFTGLTDKISGLLKPAKQAIDTVKEVKSTISDLGGIVDDVILGKFGNGKERFDALTKAGENYYRIQNKVNEKLGDSFRYTDEQINAQDKLLGKQKESTKSKSEESKETAKLTDEEKKRIKTLAAMSDEQLRSKGYSEEQIAAFKELRNTADKLGIPLNKFIDNLDEINGRWLLLNSFKNIGTALSKIFSSIGQAWKEIFDPINSDQIFNVIAAFHKFTASLIMNKDTADDLKRTFKGLFAIIDIIRTIAGGGLKIAFKVLSKILGAFDMNVLDLTGNIGDAIVKFRDWLFENNKIVKAFDKIIEKIPAAIKVVKEWIDAFLELSLVQKAIDGIKDGINKFKEIGKNVIEGLKNGLSDGISSIPDMLLELGRKMINTIKNVLGIHSPSTEFFEIGRNIIEGLVNGIVYAVSGLWKLLKFIGSKIINFIKNIDFGNVKNKGKNGLETIIDFFGNMFSKLKDMFSEIDLQKIFAAAIGIGTIMSIKKFSDGLTTIGKALDKITKPLSGLGDMFTNIGIAVKKLSKSMSTRLKAAALKDIAISIAILAGAIIALTFIEPDKLWESVYVVMALAGILVALAVATELTSKASIKIGKSGASANNLKAGLLAIGGALLLLAVTVKLIGSLDPDQAKRGFIGLGGLIVAIASVFAAYGLLVKGKAAQNIDKAGKMLVKLSISLLLLVAVVKLIGKLEWSEMIKGAAFLGGFLAFLTLFMLISKIGKDRVIEKIGKSILKISIALLLLVIVVKLVSKLDYGEMIKGAVFLGGFLAFLTLFVLISKIGGKEIPKIGRTLLAISTSLLILVAVVKLVGMLEYDEMLKGAAFLGGFLVFLAGFMLISRIGKSDVYKAAGTILALSIAIGILAGVSIVLSLIDLKGLAKGIVAVGILGAIMALMIVATRGANDCKGNLIVMTVAIGVMVAAVAALSLIDTKKLIISVAALSLLMGMFAVITKVAGSAKSSVGSLIAITGVVLVLTGVIYLLSKIDTTSMMAKIGSLIALMGSMALMLYILKPIGKQTKSALGGVLALTAMAVPLLAFIGMLALMNKVSTATENVKTLVILIGALILLLIPLTIIGNFGASPLLGVLSLTAMAIPLLAFVGILALMNKIQNATENVKALVILAGALTLLLIPLTIIGNFIVSALLGVASLLAMAIPLLAFVGILALMNKIQNATTNANLLIDLMTTMSDILIKLALVAPLAVIGVGAMAALTGLILAIGVLAVGIGALIDKFPSIQEFLDTGIPVMEQLAFGIGSMLGNFVAGFSEAIMQMLPKLGECLSEFMEKITPFINGVKMVDESVLTGVGILAAAIIALTVAELINGVASLMPYSSSLAELGTELSLFMMNALPFIAIAKTLDSSMMEGVKALVETIILITAAELLNAITSFLGIGQSMTDFKEQLTAFGDAIVAFSNKVSGNIDADAVEAAANAGLVMTKLQSAIASSGGLIQDLVGQKNLAEFGLQLIAFGNAIVNFSKTVAGNVNEEAVTAAANAGMIMAKLQDSIQATGGVVQWFVGQKDLANFGTQLVAFGDAIVKFSNKVEEGIDIEAIEAAANAGSIMAKLQENLEPIGGVVDWFTGKDDLGTFGSTILTFGEAMVDFSSKVSGNIDQEAVTAAANAGLIMAELDKSIPKDKWLDGKVSLSDFGSEMKSFGGYIKGFSDQVSGVDADAISTSLDAATDIIEIAKILEETEMADVKTSKLTGIAGAIKSYSNKIEDVSFSKISSSISSTTRLVDLVKSMVGLDSSGVKSFKVESIGKSIKEYSGSVSGIDSGAIYNSISAAKRLVSLIKSMVGLDTSGVSSFKSAIKSLGSVQVDDFASSFNSASLKLSTTGSNMMDSIAKGMKNKQGTLSSTSNAIISSVLKNVSSKTNTFVSVGRAMVDNIAKGINDIKSRISSSLSSSIHSAISDTRGYYDSFYNAGSYLVSGFANGISANAYKATARAVAMANAAKKAVKDALDINSPSKVFYKLGGFTGLGFVNALDDYADKSYSAAYNIGDYARNGLSKAINKVNSIINDDFDSQPTIRPILDLSDVESGVGTIGNMFDRRLSIGAVADVNAISSMMNQRNQNGVDSDVVSAINKLRKDLGNTRGGDTYNVNGVTYDDGSNISNAVKSIVRAARIERRT